MIEILITNLTISSWSSCVETLHWSLRRTQGLTDSELLFTSNEQFTLRLLIGSPDFNVSVIWTVTSASLLASWMDVGGGKFSQRRFQTVRVYTVTALPRVKICLERELHCSYSVD